MPAKTPNPEPLPEGWQAEMRYGQRVAHYIRGTFSLCGNLGFYRGPLVAGGRAAKSGPGDCAKCKRLVAGELEKAAK